MTKKQSRKQTIIHPFYTVLSMLTFLAVCAGCYMYYRTLLTPSDIMVADTPTIPTCTSGFIDNFEKTALDANFWTPDANATGRSLALTSGQLIASMDNVASTNMRLVTKNYFSGNFISEVDVPSVTSTTGTGFGHFLARTEDGKYGVWIRRSSIDTVETFFTKDGTSFEGQKSVAIPTGATLRLKIERQGKNFFTYYKTAGNFVLLGTFNDITDLPMQVRLTAENNSVAKYDDFSVGCAPTSTPAISTHCDGLTPRTAISWTGQGQQNNIYLDISEKSNFAPFANKLVRNVNTTELVEFNNVDVGYTAFVPKFDTTYYMRVWNGFYYSSPTVTFKIPVCKLKPTSNTTTLKVQDKTCNSLYLTWDAITNAEGYIVDLADNAKFDNAKTTGQIGSDQTKRYYDKLASNTDYYARITIAGLDGGNQYTTVGPIRTTCATPTPKPTVRATARPTIKPTPEPTITTSTEPLVAPTAKPSYAPAVYVPTPTPDMTASTKPVSAFEAFFTWLGNLFK